MIAEYNDGGRARSSHEDERWDCAVRSIAIVLGLPYDDVHRKFRIHGREYQDGVTTKQFERVLNDLCKEYGFECIPVKLSFDSDYNVWTTQRIIKVYESDTIVMDTFVEFRGKKYAHLCACVRGVIQDMFLPYDQKVKRVYIIQKKDEQSRT